MNYAALKSEVQTDALAIGYSAYLPASPGYVADLLNAQKYSMVKSRFVTARTVLSEILGGAALLDKLQAISSSVSAVKYALTFLNQDSGIDIGNSATQGMVDQLVAGGALTAAEGTSLKNMAIQPASRAEVLGFGRVNESDLHKAGVI